MFKNDASFLIETLAIFQEEVNVVKDAAGITPAFVLQPITPTQMSHFSKNGGNPLGLSPIDGPLVCEFFLPPLSTSR
jgi:hypothetical protein